ncbi:unnamed protein product [Heligmosomoides polygyrus]|uniref:1-acyl-sn-glycerol-3-phosphate acyltransferase delta n=1 Tax=Heligmosomoides polygyrus TaxID=6339 RepID=A0A183FFL0_HELPZ|nr:unnamed protein product [Heligmosomoides polygyrus]
MDAEAWSKYKRSQNQFGVQEPRSVPNYEVHLSFSARYYETGEFQPGVRGKRVVFSWAKIIGLYVFWFASFYAQYQIYSWICMKMFVILTAPFM